jgi:hypothetical protein
MNRWRRRSALEQAVTFPFDPLRDVPFVLACVECDCDSPDSYEQAIAEGWTHISYAPDGFSSNFYGYCPEHRLWELEEPPDQPRGKEPPTA